VDVDDDSDSDINEASSRICRLPSPPVPLWMDTEKIVEELELPKSSDDLLLERDLVMKAVAIYEPLRRFHQLVRLSPFRFEDFCAALGSEEQSSLLAEIHIQLLKTILREEDGNGTVFGPTEVKDSVQAVLYFVDNLTWPESLRAYMESDPSWAAMYEQISSVEYPFCGPELRIKVLMWLVDLFLATTYVREALLSEGNILHEDHCRSCNRLGELICCETCPAVYHLGCINPPLKDDEDPPDDWKCPVCIKHRVRSLFCGFREEESLTVINFFLSRR
jgi:nucleosome-remodeling factor subunit BPTF